MIHSISLNMAKRLGNTLGSKVNIEVYAYALQLVLMLAVNLAVVVLVASFLEIVPTTLAFLTVFLPFRAFGGGVHLSTFPRCIIVGSFLMLGSGYYAAVVGLQQYQLDMLLIFTLLTALVTTINWVPASTKKNPVKDIRIIKIQKRNMFITIGVWICGICGLIYFNKDSIAFSMILGAIVSTLLISPLGFYLMGIIDRALNQIRKGGTDQ